MENIAGKVIQMHSKSVAQEFYILKDEENELLLIDGLSRDNIYPINEVHNSMESSAPLKTQYLIKQ